MKESVSNHGVSTQRIGKQPLHCPVILVAGTGSGVGKTSVTLALVRALVRSGLEVQPFKVGPDYLDPTYLSLAAERTCYNLDTWMCGRDYVASLVAEKSRNSNIAVIEGAMGLFDGAGPDSSQGSAAEIAHLLDAPVLLICDAKGQARSFAATVKGFAEFEPGVRIVGIVANFCGSRQHVRLLEEALQVEHLPPLIGGIEKGMLPRLNRRHLGLVSAEASMEIDHTLEELGDAFTARVSLDRVLELARRKNEDVPKKSTCLHSDNNQATFSIPSPTHDPRHRVRLGIARDTAFHFYYPDNLQAFENAGFELAPFSPMTDTSLPDGLHALYIGGGYPELAAKTLSENEPMLAAVRSFCHTGRPVYAECGGLMYLCEGIALKDGALHAMAGILPGVCRMQGKIGALGYAEVFLAKPSLFGEAGTRLRGHAFHYSVFDDSLLDGRGWTSVYDIAFRKGRASIREGYQKENVLISYVHLHLASQPSAVVYFRDRCVNAAAEIKGELRHG